MQDYPIVPGRGLVTENSTQMRLEFLSGIEKKATALASHNFSYNEIQNKIESFIGSVEIPLGLIGPLLFRQGDNTEYVYGVAATLEGALIASMNRGAKAISNSGGFSATFLHQRMVRCPMFIFKDLPGAALFSNWMATHVAAIKNQAEKHSNHAILQKIDTAITGHTVHARFVYTTGDASGQNMSTTCTWHAMLWLVNTFEKETGVLIEKYVVEGNGASDKKVSYRSLIEGRGVSVVAECFLPGKIIQKVLRTSAEDIFSCYAPSLEMAKIDGMVGYNINVSNAIAAIFAATGQDLGSLHESSVGMLAIEKKEDGLFLSLKLPALVIGTVGGGTALPKQKQALELMDCAGKDKVQRFAKLIAGFALSLEISTYAAIVSGEFSKAHEKLGRNKPVHWLTRSSLDKDFITRIISPYRPVCNGTEFVFDHLSTENGIITNITRKLNNKLLGFIPFSLVNAVGQTNMLIKSKALDIDVIKGLHAMAASIDPALSDLIFKNREALEYQLCHMKELQIYKKIDLAQLEITPKYYGQYEDQDKEAYLLFMELLDENELAVFNSENRPWEWDPLRCRNVIRCITRFHQHFSEDANYNGSVTIPCFKASAARPLYEKMIRLICEDEEQLAKKEDYLKMAGYLYDLDNEADIKNLPLTVIHNDFNPRNIAIRKNEQPCIYDWELAVRNIPHRDIVEFLAFILPENFEADYFLDLLEFHRKLWPDYEVDIHWHDGYRYAIKEFLVCRASFYKVAGIVMKFKFTERVMANCFRMITLLKSAQTS